MGTLNLNKVDKLRTLSLSILSDPVHKEELQNLARALNFNEDNIVQSYIDYDLDVFSYDNTIYDMSLIRFVMHMHNLLKGSWHIERQQAINQFIKQVAPKKVIDLGFGVPSLYIRECLIYSSFKLTLCDYSYGAFTFASQLLNIWEPSWVKKISFLQEDMMNVYSCIGDYDLYIFQDSIEHVSNPTQCLKEFVNHSASNAQFLLSLPLGPLIPMHTISWSNKDEAIEWLKDCGLKPYNQETIKTNPKVDLFANEVPGGFTEYIVICNKI